MKMQMREWILIGLLVSSIIIVVSSAFGSITLTQPMVDFVSPTPPDNSEISVDHLVINATVTSTENISTLILNWNGTNHTMFCSGDISITKPYEIYGDLTISGLQNGLYFYKVYANDTEGNCVVSETRVVIVNATALPWDLNNNGQVDVGDLVMVGNHFGETGDPGWIQCDFNNNGQVDVGDLVMVGNHFGEII